MKAQSVDTQMAILQELHNRLLKKIEDRAADPAMQGVTGGSTGLLVRREIRVGNGETQRTVVNYELDTITLRKLLAVEERARVLMECVHRP